jgi:hypothetical protein
MDDTPRIADPIPTNSHPSAPLRHEEMRLMVMPLPVPVILAALSLELALSPVWAGEKKAAQTPARPFGTLGVLQNPQDSAFSIRARVYEGPPDRPQIRPSAQAIIPLGRSLTLDAAIFSRFLADGKDVSDAPRR